MECCKVNDTIFFNKEDMLVKRVFTYWVNAPGASMPAYLDLCMSTWKKYIPDLEIVVINHDNLSEWIDDSQWVNASRDIERFKRIGYMLQSDIVSQLVLVKHGGIFMDADTIITKDIFDEINTFDPDSLIAFGKPGLCYIHVAIQIALNPGNSFLSAVSHEATIKLNNLPQESQTINWDFFSNSIYSSVYEDESIRKCLHLLDRQETGNILESHYFTALDTMAQYVRFYFEPHKISVKEALKKVKFGAISLHNSFTPDPYKELSQEQVLEKKDCMLSKILKRLLA